MARHKPLRALRPVSERSNKVRDGGGADGDRKLSVALRWGQARGGAVRRVEEPGDRQRHGERDGTRERETQTDRQRQRKVTRSHCPGSREVGDQASHMGESRRKRETRELNPSSREERGRGQVSVTRRNAHCW